MELKTYTPENWKNIKINGRTTITKNALNLFWTASGIECLVSGSELWINFGIDYNQFDQWIVIFINDAFYARQMITKEAPIVCVFRNMSEDVKKKVCIRKENDPRSEDLRYLLSIKSIKSDGEFFPLQERSLKIEFVGDSITSGEGLYGSQTDMDWVPMMAGTINNYAVMTAEKLNAEYRLLSHGGFGVVCGWNNDTNCVIPPHYNQVCGIAWGAGAGFDGENANNNYGAYDAYDFSSWKSDVVVINLGTNDSGSFDQLPFKNAKTGKVFKNRKNPDGTLNEDDVNNYENAVRSFIKDVRHYNPHSHIIWALGVMDVALIPFTKKTVEEYAVTTKDSKLHFVLLPSMTEETRGSFNHPGVLTHKEASDVLVRFIKSIL